MVFPRWRKVLRDLWSNKTRTLLVILSIAVGVAAIGVVAGTYAIITRELPDAYSRVNPTSATIYSEPFDDEMLRVLQNMGLARDLEGRYSLRVSTRVALDKERDIYLNVIPNFSNIRINKIFPESGAWPPGKEEMLIERASLPLLNAVVGDTLTVETPDGRTRQLKISGLAHDITGPAGTFIDRVSGYITTETLQTLGYQSQYNELLLTVSGSPPDPERVKLVADELAEKIRKSGRNVFSVVLANPGRLWFESFVAPMASILGILGVIILLMSGLLVVNTISALMAQQIRQIGIMKAVGGRADQIGMMYLVSMGVIGLAALVLAIPLANLLTRSSVQLLAGIINFNISSFQLPQPVLYLQLALSLFVPLVAASFPISSGARITVREAISDYGLTKGHFGDSFFDKLIGRIRGLPRPLLLSLRNTFRQKSRLSLTLLTLSIASAIFIAVISVYASLTRTLDQALRYYGFDVIVQFNRPYRVEQIAGGIRTFASGIDQAETWDAVSSRMVLPNGTETDNIVLIAPATNTALIKPTLLAGRWLKPGDEDAIVINTDVLRLAPDVRVGQQLTLNVNDKKTTWTVVGIIRSVLSGPSAYANYPYFSRLLGRFGQAAAVYVKTTNPGLEYEQTIAKLLESHFEQTGLKVASTTTVSELRITAIRQYNVIFIFLILMAFLLTIVGGLGLTGTMSLNVLERTREIGVLRAVGASNGSVLQIIIFEGLLIGVLSWLIGLILAVPLSWLLGNAVGNGFLREPLQFTYSIVGALAWFGVILLLASIASLIPARRAVRLTVRDVLAYE